MKTQTMIEIRMTRSRGYGTEGWNIATLYANGIKKATTKGGGYDMKGVVIGEYLDETFKAELSAWARENRGARRLWHSVSTSYPGLFYDTKRCEAFLQGEVGYDAMLRIAREILGIDFVPKIHTDKSMTYIMQDTQVGIAA